MTRLGLAVKTALMSTIMVLFAVGATGVWQYRSLARQYVVLMQQQQQAFAELAATNLDYKIGSHLDSLAREASRASAETFASSLARQRFLSGTGLSAKFDRIALVGLDGTVLDSDPATPKPLNIADRDYFQRARDSGKPVISAPIQARSNDQPAVVMLIPVRDHVGGITGMVAGGMSLSKTNVLGDLARERIGEAGYYLIETAAPRPVYVVHSDPLRVLKPVLRPAEQDPRDLTGSATISSTGWVLRATLPAAAAYAPLARAQQVLVLQMVALGLLCSILVWIGTMWMMRPLGRLHGAIHALRRAPDRATTLDLHARDELGDLARDFDALMAELRDQRIEMATITDASPMGLFRCDRSGRMDYVNDAYLEIHGLARADAAQGWLSLVPEAVRDRVWQEWQQLAQDDQPFQVTRWLQRPDGEKVLVSLHMRPILVDGRVSGQVGTVSDITLRTRAEQALRTLTAIFEATTDFVVQLDNSGNLTYMNPAARRVTGIAPDAPIAGLTMTDFNPPTTLDRIMSEAVPIAAAKGIWLGELEIWNAEHVVFPVSQMVIAHRDRKGKIERFSAIMRDVSADRANKLALSESEARLRTMADALPMMVTYIDAAERYQFVNTAYEGLFKVARASIPGRTVAELLGETEYTRIAPHIHAALRGEHVSFESEILTATDYTCFETSYIPQRSVDGQTVVGIHTVTIDITQQKREERRLLQLASQDPLTGLGNRSAFESRLAEAMAQCRLHGSPMALLFLDLDRFKKINDRWGHLCGDALLRAVAARLLKATRSKDFVARLGGDEFTVIMQAMGHPDDAAQLAQRILTALNEPFVLEDRTLQVSASVGVAGYAGGAISGDELTRKADEMLYQAKGAGRNNFQVAPSPDPVEAPH